MPGDSKDIEYFKLNMMTTTFNKHLWPIIYKIGENKSISTKIKNQTAMSTSSTLQSARNVSSRNNMRGSQGDRNRKGRNQSLLHIKDPKDSTRKFSDLIRNFNEVLLHKIII